ncbi:uncharacterized protein LOC129719990 [Wyeomyia smithii]|uniref:uncharacterized protein LOC129719990 n=1 Tax=Wyeomyia smithii TaxID=174621 RepID=UPI002467CF34|nr:uncharacterized protein LOC129719990 [Wyeomyia smithii]
MTAACHTCKKEVTDASVQCCGFCKAVFHLKCCNISPAIAEEIHRNKQLFWMCQSCTSLMGDIRFRAAVGTAFEFGLNNAFSAHGEIAKSLKTEIMVELKNEIRSNFTALINSSSHTPKSSTWPIYPMRSVRSRRLFQKSEIEERRQSDLMCGTGNSLSPSDGTFTVPPPSQKFWIYLSRISRDVTAEQVCELAKQRLGTNDVEAVRLVAKGKDIKSLSFISFKVGISADLKSKALSTSTWPRGMLFREFRDNNAAENFWNPVRSLNADPQQSSIMDPMSTHSLGPQDEVVMTE